MASMATTLAGLLSPIVGGLRGTTRVGPLSDSLYRLTARELDGTPIDLGRFAGRVSLVVNVASECGFTPQYAGLQELYDRYRTRGFVVLGFPSNEFGGQEPGGPPEIRRFCEREYGVTFPLFEKTQTKPGPAQSPVWRRLGESGHLPAWNFYKFLVGRDGQVVAVFPTNVPPDSRAVRQAIERALANGG